MIILSTQKLFSPLKECGIQKVVVPNKNYSSKPYLIDWSNAPLLKIIFYHAMEWVNPKGNIKYIMDSFFDFSLSSDVIRKNNIYSPESIDEFFNIYQISLIETIDVFNSRLNIFSEFNKISHPSSQVKQVIVPMLKNFLRDE